LEEEPLSWPQVANEKVIVFQRLLADGKMSADLVARGDGDNQAETGGDGEVGKLSHKVPHTCSFQLVKPIITI
jgi:hypothetical protein